MLIFMITWVNIEEASHEYGITPIKQPKKKHYEVIVLAVADNEFIELGIDTIRGFGKSKHILYDVKYTFSADDVDGRL